MTPSEIAEALEARHRYDRINYPPASPLDRQAAATIRAQAEALKIATGALVKIEFDAMDGTISANDAVISCGSYASDAIARIKEVG